MGRVKRRQRRKVIVLIIEIVCVAVLGLGLFRIVDIRAQKHQQEIAAEEAAEKEKEEARLAELERQKKEDELKQWNLLLVNQWNAMPDDFDIVTVEVEDGYVIDERVCDALKEMLADCRKAGYSPKIISTFRTRETQQYLYNHTANKADTAIPGHSEHECGLAADIIDSASSGWGDPLIEK